MGVKRTTALTREAAWKAKQMYEEMTDKGRRRYTMMEIADFLGCGETTAWRAIRSVGPYQTLPAVQAPDAISAEAKESEQRFRALLESGEVKEDKRREEAIAWATGGPKPEWADRPPVATLPLVIPPSPLDGGDAPSEGEGAELAKLREIAGAGDQMLNELTKEKPDV